MRQQEFIGIKAILGKLGWEINTTKALFTGSQGTLKDQKESVAEVSTLRKKKIPRVVVEGAIFHLTEK